ncbi:MAG: hypothetical protein HY854_02730 [Burkholderiales bacterium]|nr:hypothetical protein [Burkholderiales bacterium]
MRRNALALLAAPRLTVAGFALLAGAVGLAQWRPDASPVLVAAPLALLAANLAAALCVCPRLRRGGLGVFHCCLLACLLLVAWGRLTHFDGRLTIIGGQEFDPDAVETAQRGPWHGEGLRALAFLQGPFTVSYAPGVRREHTRSTVELPGSGERTVGDDTPLVIGGYRFYTTHNKGFAPVLTWTANGASPLTGAVMLPSYPANDWQQVHKWAHWQFSLRLPPVAEGTAWTLAPETTHAVLVAEAAGQRFELRPGDVARTSAGTLRYEFLSGWMGYRIFYDRTLLPLLALSIAGVLGMAWHLWARGLRWLPVKEGVAA